MREKGKSLDALEPSNARFGEIVSVRQQQPLGLGHAVWCARDIVGDEPFAVLLPDDLMAGTPGALRQMVDAWEQRRRQPRRDGGSARGKDQVLRHHHSGRDPMATSPKCAVSSRSRIRASLRRGWA